MPELRDYSTVLLDVDGVLCRGEQALPGAAALLDFLRESRIPFVCVTNSAALSPVQRAARLRAVGIDVMPEQIMTSALAVRDFVDGAYPDGARIYAIGGAGLHEALWRDGKHVDDAVAPDVVVVSHDDALTYDTCRRATQHILAGARFLATNPDVLVPSDEGLEPETGALIGYLEAATGVQAHVVGKPMPDMFRFALRRLGANGRTLMIGDRLDTDIAGAHSAGLHAALMMTGVTDAAALDASTDPPDHVFADLPSLLAAWNR